MSVIRVGEQQVDVTLNKSGLGHGHQIAVIRSPLDPEDPWVLEVRPCDSGYIAAIHHVHEGNTDLGWRSTLADIRHQAARVVLGYEPVDQLSAARLNVCEEIA